MWPVAIAVAFGMVKVGNIECVLVKRTPVFISRSMVGAVCGFTIPARRPSATNRMTLWGRVSARAAPEAHNPTRQATMTRRMTNLRPIRAAAWPAKITAP